MDTLLIEHLNECCESIDSIQEDFVMQMCEYYEGMQEEKKVKLIAAFIVSLNEIYIGSYMSSLCKGFIIIIRDIKMNRSSKDSIRALYDATFSYDDNLVLVFRKILREHIVFDEDYLNDKVHMLFRMLPQNLDINYLFEERFNDVYYLFINTSTKISYMKTLCKITLLYQIVEHKKDESIKLTVYNLLSILYPTIDEDDTKISCLSKSNLFKGNAAYSKAFIEYTKVFKYNDFMGDNTSSSKVMRAILDYLSSLV
jgi:hypothetical protein